MNAQSDQKRDAAAAILAQSAQTWPMVTLKKAHGAFSAGSRFYGVPSSTPGAHYLANAVVCQCPDYQRAGNICKHVRAVRVFEAQQREVAVQAAPAPAPSSKLRTLAQLTGGCERPGCPEDAIGKTGRCGAHFLNPLAE